MQPRIAQIAARQIEPPLYPAYSENLQGRALDSLERGAWGGCVLAASTTVAASLKKGKSAFLFELGSRKAQPLEGPIPPGCLHAMTEFARSHNDSSFPRKP